MRTFFLLTILISCSVFSQDTKPGYHHVKTYSTGEYNFTTQNWSSVQDNRGVMYFGNNEGVFMYDGIEWSVITIPNSSIVRALASNEKGIVFVGASSEFGYLEPDNSGKLLYVSLSSQLDSAHACNEAVQTILTHQDNVWYCTYNAIYHFKNLKTHGVIYLSPRSAQMTSLVDSIVYPTDYLEGIQYLDGDTIRKLEIGSFFEEKSIFAIAKLNEEELIITTYMSGVHKLNLRTGEIQPFLAECCDDFLSENRIYHSSLLKDNHAVYGSIDKGVLITDLKGKRIAEYNEKSGLINQTVTNTYQKDASQPLWLTSDEGINKVDISVPITSLLENNGLNGTIYDLTVFNGKIIVATSLGVFYSVADENGNYAFEQFKELNDQTWNLFTFQDTYSGKEVLLIATQAGTFEINTKWEVSKIEKNIKEFEERSLQGRIFYQSRFNKEIFYLGTDRGLISFGRKHGKWSKIGEKTLNVEVRSIYEIDEETIWISTYYNGIKKLNLDNNTIVDYGIEKGLKSLVMNKFSILNDSLIIIGDGGAFVYDEPNDSIIPYKYLCKFLNKEHLNIFELNAVNNNDFWIYISDLNTKKWSVRHISLNENNELQEDSLVFKYLPDSELEGFYAKDQYRIFGVGSAIYFYEENYNFDPAKKFNALIREIRLEDGDSVIFGGSYFEWNEDLEINLLSTEQPASLKYQLDYKYNDLTFYVAAPYFTKEDKIEFRYFLEGDDKRWSAWTSEPKYVRNNLHEGKYKFHVEARNVFGIVSEQAIYEFEILPPFYRSVLAIIFYFIAFIVFVWGVVKWNTRRLVQEKIQLEKIVAERTAEVRKQKDEIEQQKEEIEDSIHYASRIQRAVLPTKERLDAMLTDYFILFKPRDIVSGDFYWMGEKDNKVVLIAADCTGHGVPGAFMSMLGVSFLNDIVNKNDIIQSALILNELRTNVKSMLKQEGKEGEAKDGMDVALIIIDYNNMKVQFSGAYNPLYLYRNKELIEYKADKMPIGIYVKEKESFTTNEIDIQKGDALYIFSDGFVDQFGGPNERKFMTKNFKLLLGDICDKPMVEQREILDKTNVEWRGKIDQIDDIIVVGVRI